MTKKREEQPKQLMTVDEENVLFQELGLPEGAAVIRELRPLSPKARESALSIIRFIRETEKEEGKGPDEDPAS